MVPCGTQGEGGVEEVGPVDEDDSQVATRENQKGQIQIMTSNWYIIIIIKQN